MATIKTIPTAESVTSFINGVANEVKRKDCIEVVELIKEITHLEPQMWGPGIIGFGTYHYKYATGHEGDMPLVGFSPRATSIVFYVSENFEKKETLLKQLGKHTTGKVCIYVKKLADIDTDILKKIIINSIKDVQKTYPA